MIKRSLRATRKDIEEAIKKGKIIQSNSFYMKVLKNQSSKTLFSVVVPKKVEKTSVGRHLIKRKIMSAIEDLISDLKKESGAIIVVFGKKIDKKTTFSELKNDMRSALERGGLV